MPWIENYVNIFANVARSLEESEVQAKTGKAVLSSAEAEVREQIEITESSLSNAAEAVAKHADEIFEKGALENAIVEAETLVKQEDATILIPENGDTEDANAVKTSEDGDVDPDPKE